MQYCIVTEALFAISFYGKYATVFLFAMILVTYSGSPLLLVILYFIPRIYTIYASSLFMNNNLYRSISRLYLYHIIGSFYLLIWASVLLLISLLRTKRQCQPSFTDKYVNIQYIPCLVNHIHL